MVFFGRYSSGIKKPKFWQWFFFLADIAVVSKHRNFGNFFFFFADIAVVSKNRNYGNGFFLSVFHGLSLKH